MVDDEINPGNRISISHGRYSATVQKLRCAKTRLTKMVYGKEAVADTGKDKDGDSLHGISICDHAQKRMQQRGISSRMVGCVLKHSDRKLHKGEGCMTYAITRKRASKLRKAGIIEARLAEKVCDMAVVLDQNNKMVITVMHAHDSHSGQGYYHD